MTGSTDFLQMLGSFAPTIKGDELKGWIHDHEDGGVMKVYLSADECREVARQFVEAAKTLESNDLSEGSNE